MWRDNPRRKGKSCEDEDFAEWVKVVGFVLLFTANPVVTKPFGEKGNC